MEKTSEIFWTVVLEFWHIESVYRLAGYYSPVSPADRGTGREEVERCWNQLSSFPPTATKGIGCGCPRMAAQIQQTPGDSVTGYQVNLGIVDHPSYGAVRGESRAVYAVGNGEVWATLGLMRQYALEDAWSAPIQMDAAEVRRLAGGAGADKKRLAEVAWEYVKSRVRFLHDDSIAAPVLGQLKRRDDDDVIEILVRPVDMSSGVGERIGDCDDYSMWLASILVALGVPCAFVVVAADPRDTSRYSHVYVAAYPSIGERIALDASHGPAPGWEAPDQYGLVSELPVNRIDWLLLGTVAAVVGITYAARQWTRLRTT